MNESARAGFLPRAAAFICDAILVSVLVAMLTAAWAVHAAGVLPDTADHAMAAFDASERVPEFVPVWAVLGYVIASWTPLLGGRSLGMRLFGLQVVRPSR